MSEHDDLYRAVLEEPDREGPRRRYAQYLARRGDELGEYIELALAKARRALSPAQHPRYVSLQSQLRARLCAPVEPWVRQVGFDRGLVASVKMDGQSFLDHGREVFALAPIQHLDLVDAKPVLAAIVHSPVLERVQTLAIEKGELGDAEASLIATSPCVRRLVYLNLWGNRITQVGVEAIAASHHLAGLRVLEFGYNPVEDPVSRWSNDGVSGLTYYEGAGPLQALLKQTYGERAWMEPPENLDRHRMCDAGE